MPRHWKIFMAEFIGTTILMLGGPGTAVLATGGFPGGIDVGILGVALAFGLALFQPAPGQLDLLPPQLALVDRAPFVTQGLVSISHHEGSSYSAVVETTEHRRLSAPRELGSYSVFVIDGLPASADCKVRNPPRSLALVHASKRWALDARACCR